eukprot:bmy_19267T0
MSRALDILLMREEDVHKFLAAGTHLGGNNLDFQMEHDIYIINMKRNWEKLRSLCWQLVPLKTQLISVSYPPRLLVIELC